MAGKTTIKDLLDAQRRILHDRLSELVKFNSESDSSDFVLDVMKDLPYPDYNQFEIISKETRNIE